MGPMGPSGLDWVFEYRLQPAHDGGPLLLIDLLISIYGYLFIIL
jgi:hypothetical protein